jgi:hypothetical protein
LSVIEKPWSSAPSLASGSFCKMTSFRIYFVTVEYAMASDRVPVQIRCSHLWLWLWFWPKAPSDRKHHQLTSDSSCLLPNAGT